MPSVTDGTHVYSPHAFERELEVGCQAALQAGHALMQLYGRQIEAGTETGIGLKAEAARVSEQIIRAAIQESFAQDALLCEAAQDTPDRFHSSRVWIIDSLDGTNEFATGMGEFSVMIAFLQESALRVGVVYQPVGDVLYYALAGGGAYRSNGHGPERLRCAPSTNGVGVGVTRSPADPIVLQLCRENGFTDIEPGGSVGLQCARIAEGGRHLYVHPVASMGEWDTAAPELILTEAGGSVTDCLGRALTYNKQVPLQSSGVLAAHPTLTFRVIPTLARMMKGERHVLNRRSYGK